MNLEQCPDAAADVASASSPSLAQGTVFQQGLHLLAIGALALLRFAATGVHKQRHVQLNAALPGLGFLV